jgi:hypothetical protein
LKEIQIYAKRILAVQAAAGIYVMTGTKKSAADVFHASTIALMGFMKSFRVTRTH